jgi:succinate dehydrogenase/fumarate reductase cytochrome b subunit
MTLPIKITLWIIRGVSGILFCFFLIMILAHLMGEQSGNDHGFRSIREATSFYSMIAMAIGLGVAIFKEGIGGVLVLLSALVFFWVRPDLTLDPIFIIIPILGLTFITLWYIRRKKTQVS